MNGLGMPCLGCVAGPPALGFAAVAVKATLILALAALATAAARRGSAAFRHRLWTATTLALLALPVLAWRLPPLPVPIWRDRTAPAAEQPAAYAPVRTAVTSPVAARGAGSAATAVDRVPAPEAALPAEPRTSTGWDWLAALWLGGALLACVPVVLGLVGTWWLARGAAPVREREWTTLAEGVAAELGVRRRVRLLRSHRTTMPLTWGTLRPVVLLPYEADGWSEERRRVVLLHEMAHVRRLDCLTQRLALLCRALYWPHPGVWWVAARMRAEREHACDEQVLGAGTRASEYAAHLLELARGFRAPRLAGVAAIGMARPSRLEGRLLAVLDPRRRCSGPARRHWGISVVAMLLVVPLAAARAVAVESTAPAASPTRVEQAPPRASAPVPRHTQVASAERPRTDSWMVRDTGRVLTLEFPGRSGGTLTLDLRAGGSVRITGWDRPLVRLRAEMTERNGRRARVEARATSDGVRVETTPVVEGATSYGGGQLDLWVPRAYNVRIRSAGGGIAIAGVRGSFTGQTNGGPIALANVRGQAQLTTAGGPIAVQDAQLSGSVHTNGGPVALSRVTGGLRATTSGGPVTDGRRRVVSPAPPPPAAPPVPPAPPAPFAVVTDNAPRHAPTDYNAVGIEAAAAALRRMDAEAIRRANTARQVRDAAAQAREAAREARATALEQQREAMAERAAELAAQRAEARAEAAAEAAAARQATARAAVSAETSRRIRAAVDRAVQQALASERARLRNDPAAERALRRQIERDVRDAVRQAMDAQLRAPDQR